MQHLGDHEVRDLVADLVAEEDDALVEQPREDVEAALAPRGLLDDDGYETLWVYAMALLLLSLVVGLRRVLFGEIDDLHVLRVHQPVDGLLLQNLLVQCCR